MPEEDEIEECQEKGCINDGTCFECCRCNTHCRCEKDNDD
jgi:hypothetical protein